MHFLIFFTGIKKNHFTINQIPTFLRAFEIQINCNNINKRIKTINSQTIFVVILIQKKK